MLLKKYLVLLCIFLVRIFSISSQNTFQNVNVTIVRTKLLGIYHDDRQVITKNLANTAYLSGVLKGRNPNIFNTLRIQNQSIPVIYENAFTN